MSKYTNLKSMIAASLFLFCCAGEVKAQRELDSLLNLTNTPIPYKKADAYQKIALYYKANDSHLKAIEYFEKVLVFGKENNQEDLIACTYKDIADAYNRHGEFARSIVEERKALNAVLKTNETKVLGDIYNGFVTAFFNLGTLDSVKHYLAKAISTNERINYKSGLANNYFILGRLEIAKGNKTEAVKYYEKAIPLASQNDNGKFEMQIRYNLAVAYSTLNNKTKALEISLENIAICIKKNFRSDLALFYHLQGSIYRQIGNLDKAVNCYDQAKVTYESIGEVGHNLANLYLDYGALYNDKKDHKKSLEYKIKSLSINEKIGNELNLITDYLNMGVTYHFDEQYVLAMNYYNKSFKLAKKYNDEYHTEILLNNYGEVYRDAPDSVLMAFNINPLFKYDTAIAAFKQSLELAKKTKNIEVEQTLWENLSITYQKQNNFQKAFTAYQNFIAVKDKRANDGTKQKINRLEIQYEFTKKEDSLKLIQANTSNKLLQQEFLNKQQSQNLLLQNNKLLLSQQQLSLSSKEKELQHLAFLKTQADLQNEQLLRSQKEKQLSLSENQKLLQSKQVKNLELENKVNKLNRQQQWIYTIVGLVALLLIGLFIYNKSNTKQKQLTAQLEKEKAQQLQKEAEFQKSMADVSMSALRSQMNPHFIFNCLNSIKLYTVQNNTAAASEYLTKFSKLIRMALENSRSETIALATELESLELYIQMERMRFKEKLNYEILVDKNVDASFIEIPPLLLQPYVENAIWHGLMHKEEGGFINIHVSLLENENVLLIQIKDNGVGRSKATELSSKTATKHKSYGTQVTGERLDLINQIYQTGASVITEDVLNEQHQTAGTIVTIKIPIE